MRKLRWQLFIVFLALIAIAVLLWTRQAGPDTTGLPAVDPTPQPVQGGNYSEALVGQFSRLNPLLDYANPVDRDVNHLLYRGLIKFDYRGIPQADLAESWGISQDNQTYNVSLRAAARWHDGEPVTAEDVRFTIELLTNEALPVPADIRALWQDIDVEVLDPYLLQFRLPEPYAPFLDYLTFGILPAHLLRDVPPEELVNAAFNLDPVGNGPYEFVGFETDAQGTVTGVILTAFADFYGGRPFIDTVAFRYYPDSAAALQAYQAGEVMGISHVDAATLPQVLAITDLNLYTSRLPQLTLVLFNLDNPEAPFFGEADVRRALLFGLNRQRMIDVVLSGQAVPANGPVLPGSWAYYQDAEPVGFDTQRGINLLRDTGYDIPADGTLVRAKEGISLAFTLLHPPEEPYPALARLIQENWALLGVEVTLQAVPYPELLADYLEPRAYEAALVSLDLARFPDPDPYPFWHQAEITGGQNYAQWDDRSASEYLEQARITPDVTERARLYRNFQVRFNRELPALPLFYPMHTYAVSKEVQGVQVGPLYDLSDRLAGLPGWYLRSSLSGSGQP